MLGCGIYYYAWIWLLPKLRGYRIRQEVLTLEDGAQSHKVIKVPVEQLAEWDATHDAVGRPLNRTDSHSGDSERIGVSSTAGEKGHDGNVRDVDPEK